MSTFFKNTFTYQDDVCHGASGDAQEKIASHLQPHSSISEPSLSRQRRQKKRELVEVCSEKVQILKK